jgi:hypothetical protein
MKFNHLLFALAVLLFSGGSLQAQFPCFNGITLLGPGPDPIDLCEDGQSGQIVFTTNIVALPIGYIVLDENDVIVYIGTNGRIDFGGLPGNNFRVYGFNFIGQITAQVGDVLGTPLTNGCFALTANFITVTGDALAGGTISTDDGLDEVYTCPGDSLPDVVRFINDGTDPGASFVYIITDEDNIITHILPGDSFDFEDLGEGVSRVWGLSYQGNLLAMVGDDAAGAILAEGCYALTNNFVTVIRSSPDGGTVAAEGGSQDIFYCPGSGDPNVRIDSMGASNSPYLFVLTDTSNVILALDTAGVFNLDSFPSGIYRAWGLAYTGLITAQVGDTASVASLSDGCFALSSNFVLINTEGPSGGTLSTDAGEVEVFTCPSDGIADTIRFISVGAVGDFFQFIITDTNNVILALPDINELDLGTLDEGVYRVWGLGYTGNLLTMVGDTASAVPLADECFGLSLNFVTIFNIDPAGGTVSTDAGEDSAFGCPNDSIPDIFAFDNQNAIGSNYAYVITDNDNNVLVVIDGDSADFDTLGTGQFRVWGVSFTGNLTVMAGDDFSAADLSDGCFARSENFVTVFMEQPAGGTVSTTAGLTEVFVCPGTGQSNQLSFASADASNSLYAYVVTDTNNVILELLAGNTADFDSLPSADGYRVWGLAYTGNVTAQPGDTASAVSLTDGCFDLSANFVSISLDGAAGGTVSTEDGLTEVAFCANDSLSSLLRFDSAGVSGSGFVYLVTDTSNIILNILAVDSFDFFGTTSGIFRVWGLGFTGDLQAEVGDDAAATTLSDGCFSLSSNFITVTRDAVTGGEVSTDDGLVELTLCSGDGIPDTVRFESMGAEGPFYAFVLTDTNNVILGLADDGAIDFEGLGDGVFRVWGLAFSGNLTAMVGDTASAGSLTDGCFDLSSNFVTVFNKETIGGTVSTESGDTDALLCPGDAVVSFDSSGTSGEFYAYVVTDTNNVILALLNGDSFDFDSLAVDPVRVWGLAYSGNLLAAAGDTASAIALTDECFSLSENFVTVRKEDVAGGTVSTDDGAVEVFVCPGNGIPDVVVFESAGASGAGFVFVITDENNLIIALPPDNTFDFEDSGQGVSRIWGLAYNGNLLAQIGDDAASALLADGCYALSGNFITVYHEQPVGGTVSSATGEDEVFLCPSGTGGLVEFANAGASNSLYAYLVTDLDNIVLDIATGNTADFTALGDGIYRVWGVAYTGGLTVMPGEDAAATDLSDDCFDLSSNFVTVFVEEPEGGTVSTLGGQDTLSFCVSDNEPDIVDMTTTGGGNSQYAYLVTDTNNVVQLVSTSSAVDLEGTGDGLSRIWGLAYTGNITVMAGDTASAVALSDECFSLSSNFVLVIKEALTGGTVLTDAGEEVVYTCPDDGLPDTVRFASTGLIGDSFTYLVTDTNNVILAILDEDFEDFEDYGIGVRRVWGLAYNGNLTAAVGDTASVVRLADQCFGLSANFVTVFSDIPRAGTLSTADGADEISACAVADLASLISFDSMGVVNSLFAYVVTDTNNIVLFTPSLDLSGIVLIESGLVRVWGMAYTGNITAMPGDTASIVALSDECYDLSDNFILVTLEPVAGGQVFTTDFETELFTCPDDGNPDVFFFLNFDIIGANATLAITDTNNVLINYNAFADPTDFENLPSMIYRIWSIAYSGDLLAEPGDTLDRIEIASGCFALSENFVTVNNDVPNGGRISTTDGDTVVTVIVGDGLTDFLTFESEGASNSRYVYVLTDTSNVIEEILVGDTYNFENSGLEPQRVWGLAYTGTLTAMVGDTASLVDLSDDCYSLTENFVLVLKLPPSAPELSPDELTGVQINLWPVPASQSLTVSVREVVGTTDRSPAQLLLLNQAGVLLSAYRAEAREGAQQFELDIEALPPGLYFLQYRSATEVKTERFIKQ